MLLLQIVFAFLTFACSCALVAAGGRAFAANYSGLGFCVFVGLTTMILATILLPATRARYPRFGDFFGNTVKGAAVELAINLVWCIFWLAAAACMSVVSDTSEYNWKLLCAVYSGFGGIQGCAIWSTIQAFAWMSWLLWALSLVIGLLHLYKIFKNRIIGETQPGLR